jgi:hypothetical protein
MRTMEVNLRNACLTAAFIIAASCAFAAPVLAQWSFETIDPTQYSDTWIGVDSAGTPMVVYTGPGDGMGDSRADLYFRVRLGPNNWITPAAASPTLRVIRPHLAVDAAGNAYVAYESQWAGDTAVVKFRRTGPTTWVRDAAPVAIDAGYFGGYHPKIAVGANGSIHVIVNRPVNGVIWCTYAWNSGANWQTGWSSPFTLAHAEGGGVVVDANGDAYIGLKSTHDDPNYDDAGYVKISNGSVVAGPLFIDDGGARTGSVSIAVDGTTAYVAGVQVPGFGGTSKWNQWVWSVNGTSVSEPVNTCSYFGMDTNPAYICAANGRLRSYWRTGEVWEPYWVRFAYFVSYPGAPVERMQYGYTQGQSDILMDAAGNLHAGVAGCLNDCYISYGYRPNTSTDTTPPGPVSNVSVTNVGTTSLTLNWRTPGNSDLMGTRIGIRTDRFATSLADATTIFSQVNTANHAVSTPVTGLVPGQIYYYSLFAWDNNGNLSGPVPITGRTFVRPDFNHDYDVDQTDFGHFQACFSGAFIAQENPACQDALLDGDNDVDQEDFAVFQQCLSGADVPPTPNCAN